MYEEKNWIIDDEFNNSALAKYDLQIKVSILSFLLVIYICYKQDKWLNSSLPIFK